jgi:uncharacterized membrane protein YukC
MKMNIHPGFATGLLVALVVVILYFGFNYLNNQPPDVTAARIAFYKNKKGPTGGKTPAKATGSPGQPDAHE